MSKKRSKKEDQKLIIGLISVAIVVCIILSLLAINLANKNVNDLSGEIKNVKSLLSETIDNLDSKFIKITASKVNGYKYDIYLNFSKDLFEKEKSNESAYVNLIEQVILVLKTNFRLIDETRNIQINVSYNVSTNSYEYTINGEKDYFKNHSSQNSLGAYKEIECLDDIEVNSELLRNIIRNEWKSSKEMFGEKKENFDKYDIYIDEGYSVRKCGKKVFNIVFNETYQDKIVNDISVKTGIEKVKLELGEPHFIQDNIIGYKTEEFYIFFNGTEVSVYRKEDYDFEEFEKILNEYIDKKIDVKEFVNQLTYMWDDYSNYNYESSFVDLTYANQGVAFKLSADKSNNIYFYNNYGNVEGIKKLIKDNKVYSAVKIDAIFESEIQRNNMKDLYFVPEFEKNEYEGESSKYMAIVKDNKVLFYCPEKPYKSKTLSANVKSFLWFDDDNFVYSVSGEGIYYYNLENGTKEKVLDGDNNFEFNEYKNGILYYDEKFEVEIGSD